MHSFRFAFDFVRVYSLSLYINRISFLNRTCHVDNIVNSIFFLMKFSKYNCIVTSAFAVSENLWKHKMNPSKVPVENIVELWQLGLCRISNICLPTVSLAMLCLASGSLISTNQYSGWGGRGGVNIRYLLEQHPSLGIGIPRDVTSGSEERRIFLSGPLQIVIAVALENCHSSTPLAV